MLFLFMNMNLQTHERLNYNCYRLYSSSHCQNIRQLHNKEKKKLQNGEQMTHWDTLNKGYRETAGIVRISWRVC